MVLSLSVRLLPFANVNVFEPVKTNLVSIVPFKNPTYYLQKVLPMRNFKKENRIKNTSNLLFKRK